MKSKPFCASASLFSESAPFYPLGMPRTSAPRPASRRPTYLLQWRRKRDLTQQKLAELAGMAHTSIGRLERGESAFEQETLERLAEALDISASELLFINPEKLAESTEDLLRSSQWLRTGVAMALAERMGGPDNGGGYTAGTQSSAQPKQVRVGPDGPQQAAYTAVPDKKTTTGR